MSLSLSSIDPTVPFECRCGDAGLLATVLAHLACRPTDEGRLDDLTASTLAQMHTEAFAEKYGQSVPRRGAPCFETPSPGGKSRLDDIIALQRAVIREHIHLIASACYPFDSVLRALAEPSFVLPAEGMPGARYLPGAEVMDLVEKAGEDLVLDLFGRPAGYRATLQPHSGTQANQIVFNAVLRPDDTVLCLRPRDGGHISHTVLISRRHPTVNYGLTNDGLLDYDEMRALAIEHRPRLIIAGGSSLPRAIDFAHCADIAREVGAMLHADVSHTATFIAAQLHPSTFPYADFVTFNSVKNLRGPNAGVLIYRSDFEFQVHSSLFPTTQGGANETGMLGKFACLLEWQERDIGTFAAEIVLSARTLGRKLAEEGIRLVTGGTDSHLLLLDLRDLAVSGAEIEQRLISLGVLANRNLIPSDPRSPNETSGLRIGATNLAILGYETEDLELLAQWLAKILIDGRSSTAVVEYLVEKYQRHLSQPLWVRNEEHVAVECTEPLTNDRLTRWRSKESGNGVSPATRLDSQH